MITSEQVVDAGREAESLMESYLRQQGWDHTSKFPDSRWRWKKTLPDGQMLTLSTQGAFDMESRFLDMHEQEGEVK